MNMPFFASVETPQQFGEDSYYFIFLGFRLLVCTCHDKDTIPVMKDVPDIEDFLLRKQYLGYLDGPQGHTHCISMEVSDKFVAPAGMAFKSLRQLFFRLDEPLLSLAGRAVQIVEWDRTHQFCGRCGKPVEHLSYERAKKCPNCGLTSYPRISPAIIVSIERASNNSNEILLAHNHRHAKGFYSVLAGFVEPGESLEDCVRREIFEEVGIKVKNIRYFGSQPWPFPNSLMIAFTSEYDGGDIILEEEEIADAGWYSIENLPNLPPRISIARKLIDNFVEKNNKQG